MKTYGYLDIYDRLRSWQHELREITDNLKPHIEPMSKNSLTTLDGVFYLVESQLIDDADGAN